MLENKLILDAKLKDFTFKSRHIGPSFEDEALMLQYIGYENSESNPISGELKVIPTQDVSATNMTPCYLII